jgi:short subunit dehydrogenase-like uncharacterized protein
MDDSSRDVDIGIVGATGFTGSRVVLLLARLVAERHPALPSSRAAGGGPLRVAVIGRSRERLDALLAHVEAEVPGSEAALRVRVLVADAADAPALRAAAARCHVLLACAGPFARLGHATLEACVAARTLYADVTGEPLFAERAELMLGAPAAAAGIAIVPFCGFDSIPADLGVAFAAETLRGAGAACLRVESFLRIHSGAAGAAGHFATLESAVGGFASVAELGRVRRALAAARAADAPAAPPPRYGPRLKLRGGPHWSRAARAWALPFPGADASVVRRTQRALAEAGAAGPAAEVLPVQYGAYLAFRSWWWMALTTAAGAVVTAMAQYAVGRALILRFPGFFSLGAFSHAGPSPAQLTGTSFSMTFHARGRRGSPAEVAAGGGGAEVAAVVRVGGPEPGYVATPRFLLAAGFELLERRHAAAGVLTPAAAFRGERSTLRRRLEALGILFEVLEAPRDIVAAAP